MRKFYRMLLFISILSLSGIGVSAQESAELPEIGWVCPPGFEGQTLSVYNWATYIGETTIADFERLCNVTVIYDVYDGNEALIARLRQGNPGYDIAIPSDYAIAIMIRDGLLRPVNRDNIPNFANVADNALDLPFDPGNQYSAPYLWGTAGVAYNIGRVEAPITSWYQVFAHEGPVAWLDDPRMMLGIALKLLGFDPNTVNPDEIAQARDFLIANSANVVTIAADDGQALLARGEVDIAIEYNGDVYQIIADCACEDFAYIVPEEGSVADIASLVILEGAPNPALAEAFIDYMLDPVVGAQVANFTGYASPNRATIELGLIDPELLNNPLVYTDEETLSNMWFVADVGENDIYYNDAWDEIKIAIGG